MIDYDALDEEFEDVPKTGKMAPSMEPVNVHADMLKRVESARNRIWKKRGY